MILAFAKEDDVDSGRWGDAYDDTFLAHVWHQYTIYPVTPTAIPLLIRIASLRRNAAPGPAQQIALGLRLVAESTAAFRKHAEAPQRELGELSATAFTAHCDFLKMWLGTPLEGHAVAIASWIPEIGLRLEEPADPR
jgi:hypothetical protein